jgi:L-histidine N-alpha-methyltransferase
MAQTAAVPHPEATLADLQMAVEVSESLRGYPPSIPSKYFYDDRGAALFEEITRLPEYYQTRTETALLEDVADEVIALVRPEELVELGSGVGRKIRALLNPMARLGWGRRCVFLDINGGNVRDSMATLKSLYPALDVRGAVGDFMRDLHTLGRSPGRRLLLFLGGTIGNLHPRDVPPFLNQVAGVLAPGDAFLVGLDLVKDVARLEAAYNDDAGVTARFNLNILRVVNERLLGDFDLSAFEHVAFYDAARQWIEMRLRAVRPNRVRLAASGLKLGFERGDFIRTELSCKYSLPSFAALLPGTGLGLRSWYTDAEKLFALALLERTTRSSEGAVFGRAGTSLAEA